MPLDRATILKLAIASVSTLLLFTASIPPGFPQTAVPPQPSAAQAEFFEKSVRPVLAERCFGCHGASQQSAGIRLDSATSILQAGAKGHRPIVPGSIAQSAAILAIRYDGPIKMPPQGKLSAKEIDSL